MERKKVSLSLKTGTSKNTSKEPSTAGRCITPKGTSERKGILKEGTSNKPNLSGSPLSKSGSYQSTLEKSKFQNDGLDFHCSFETDGSSEQDIDIPYTQPVSHEKILEGVVAFIEARSNTENRFEGISKQMEMLGATVVKKFTPEVTHVIFKDGKKTTREKAIKKGIHLVSVLWVESCRQSGKRVSEDLFPVVEPEQAVTPLMVGRLKRTKSMQPKAFEEDVQNSADRGDRRRKRKLLAKNLTPTAMVFCAETQDPFSPVAINPPLTPHMVPDTPCHEIPSPLTKTLSYDGDSPKEPIESDGKEADQSPDDDQDVPSSISKLKRRLLSKSTPYRLPTPPTEQKKTPAAQTRKTPTDVLLTGSEQGKKRKRQDSTKELTNDDITEAVQKRKKKAKLGGQVLHDANDTGEPSTNASNSKQSGKITLATGKNGKSNTGPNSGMCLKNTESTTGQHVGSKRQLKVSEKKKPQAKAGKKLPAAENKSGLDSDSGVSITDGSNNPSIANSACNRKKKFSKTAKLLSHVGQTEEEFEDSVSAEESGTKRQEKSAAFKEIAGKKLFLYREKLVNQGKLDSQEKPVNRVHDCEDKEEGGTITRSSIVNSNGGKRNVAKSVRISSEEDRFEDDDADVEEDTCTEEDEQRSHEENEPKTERKQRTKLVKKVRPKRSIVMTSMHFGEQDIVLSVVRKLGGFFIEDRVSSSTSHVIAGSPRRTLNVLMAIAQGSWLVSPMWMMKSLEVGYWVDEEPYELSDAFPAAQLCRLERVSAGPGYHQELFVKCPPIFVSENCSPPSDSLMSLINLCGGKVSTSVRKAGICIGSMTRRTQAVNITEQWLLDCITQHDVLPYNNYALNSPAKRRRETSPSY